MKSVLIAVRVPEAVKKKAESKAKRLGYTKPNGEANISEYIRNLIINDRR